MDGPRDHETIDVTDRNHRRVLYRPAGEGAIAAATRRWCACCILHGTGLNRVVASGYIGAEGVKAITATGRRAANT